MFFYVYSICFLKDDDIFLCSLDFFRICVSFLSFGQVKSGMVDAVTRTLPLRVVGWSSTSQLVGNRWVETCLFVPLFYCKQYGRIGSIFFHIWFVQGVFVFFSTIKSIMFGMKLRPKNLLAWNMFKKGVGKYGYGTSLNFTVLLYVVQICISFFWNLKHFLMV